MKERLQKILSSRGLASRRHAEKMILAGRVKCNGAVCNLGDSADPETDEILVDGRPLPSKEKNVYIMLNKPRRYVTTLSDEKGRKTVSQLVENCGRRVYPVGRLDMDSDGLLLLTNDGNFANKMMHPSHCINKTYRVEVIGYTKEALLLLQRRIVLDGIPIAQPDVVLIEENGEKAVLHITIHEGRNRQVRRMCDAAGMKVRRLTRISEGTLQLGDLPSGQWRYLSESEIHRLTVSGDVD